MTRGLISARADNVHKLIINTCTIGTQRTHSLTLGIGPGRSRATEPSMEVPVAHSKTTHKAIDIGGKLCLVAQQPDTVDQLCSRHSWNGRERDDR